MGQACLRSAVSSGIVVQMYYSDHEPPYFHVRNSGQKALIAIETLALLFLVCLIIGCRAGRATDLPGKYMVETEWGESTLVLREDHSMEQEVRTRRGESKQIVGTWEFSDGLLITKPCLVVRRRTEA